MQGKPHGDRRARAASHMAYLTGAQIPNAGSPPTSPVAPCFVPIHKSHHHWHVVDRREDSLARLSTAIPPQLTPPI